MFTKLINNLTLFNLEIKDLEGFIGVYLNYCRAMLPFCEGEGAVFWRQVA